MKKYAFFLLVCLGVFVSCSSNDSESEESNPIEQAKVLRQSKSPIADNFNGMIPSDAFLVGRVNVQQIIDESDVEKQKGRIRNLLKGSESDVETFNYIMANYKSMGIDLSQPIYFFMPKVSTYGDPEVFAVCKLTNEDELLALLNKDGNYASIDRTSNGTLLYLDGDIIGGYRNKMAVFGKFDSEYEVMKYLNVRDNESFFTTSKCQYMRKQSSDFTFVADMHYFEMPSKVLREMNMYNFNMDDYKDFVVGINFDFAEGEVVLSSEVLRGKLDNSYMGDNLSTDMLSYIPERNFLGAMMVSVRGKQMLGLLRSILRNSDVDAQTMEAVCDIVEKTDGTITMAVNGSNENNISGFVTMPVKESVVKKSINNAAGQDIYSLLVAQAAAEDVVIKEKDGYTCMAYKQNFSEQENTFVNKIRRTNLNHACAYMFLNAPAILKMVASSSHTMIPQEVLDAFVSLEALSTTKEGAVVLKLNTEENSLAFLLDLGLDFASK